MNTGVGFSSERRRHRGLIGRILNFGRVTVGALALAACVEVPKELPAPSDVGPLRDETTPLASQVNVKPARLYGQWRVAFSAGTGAPSRSFAAQANGEDMSVFLFDGQAFPALDRGQGRFGVLKTEYWVHWMDQDGTVALVGSVQGSVWIMTRRKPTQDRIAAAWEIFDWYGYNRDWMRAGAA